MTVHLLRPALLYSDPLEHQDLISWGAADRILLRERERGGAAFVDTFLSVARNHESPLVRAQIAEIVGPVTDVERPMALLGAACRGDIAVYTRAVVAQVAYELTPAVWLAASHWVANPVTIALTGRFSVVTDLLDERSLESRLAGCPILVERRALTVLLTRRAGSKVERLKAARNLVEKWTATHDGPMRKTDFKNALAAAFAGVSGREQDRIWAEVVPPAWREAGPRGA